MRSRETYIGLLTPSVDRGATLPERSQSSCALKLPTKRAALSLTAESSGSLPSIKYGAEAFASMPSLLQGHASIDTVPLFVLVLCYGPSVRPAMLGQVDGIAVGIEDAVFGFAVGRAFVDAGGGLQILASFAHRGDVFDFEAEVIDAGL